MKYIKTKKNKDKIKLKLKKNTHTHTNCANIYIFLIIFDKTQECDHEMKRTMLWCKNVF
jgi:hypothetical protein